MGGIGKQILMNTSICFLLLTIAFTNEASAQVVKSTIKKPPLWKYSDDRKTYALSDAKGKALTDYIFQYPSTFKNGVATAKKDSFYAFIYHDGSISSKKYTFLKRSTEGYYWGFDGQRSQRLDAKGGESDLYSDFLNFTKFNKAPRYYRLNKKQGLIDSLGRFVTPPLYDNIYKSSLKEEFLIVNIGKLYGLIDLKGRIILPVSYEKIEYSSVGLYVVKLNGLHGLVSLEGTILAKPDYQHIESFTPSLLLCKKNDLWGLLNKRGLDVCAANFERIENLTYNYSIFRTTKGGLMGIIDSSGKEIVKPEFRFISYENDFYIYQNTDYKRGVLNEKGEPVIEPIYDQIYSHLDGLFSVKSGGKGAVIDVVKQKTIPMPNSNFLISGYKHFIVSSDNYFSAYNQKLGLLNSLGEVVFSMDSINKKFWVLNPEKGIYGVKREERVSVFSPDRQESQFDELDVINDSLFIAKLNNKSALINKNLDTLTDFIYDNIYISKSKLRILITEVNGKQGMIGVTGRMISPPKYAEIQPFSDHLLLAKKYSVIAHINTDRTTGFAKTQKNDPVKNKEQSSGGYLLIDSTGNVVIEPLLLKVTKLNKYGLFKVYTEQGQGVLDKNGKWVIPPKFIEIVDQPHYHDYTPDYSDYIYGAFIYTKEGNSGLWGIWNKDKVVIPNLYDAIGIFKSGYVLAKKGNSFFYLDEKNQEPVLDQASAAKIFNLPFTLIQQYDQFGLPNEENGWIRVQKNKKWGWIDRKGKEVINCQFDAVTPFKNGRARIKLALWYNEFYINEYGEFIL
jgi:WG containing repeat